MEGLLLVTAPGADDGDGLAGQVAAAGRRRARAPLPAVVGAAEAAPPVLAAGLGEVVPDEQAAATSAAPAMNTAILDRR